MKKDFQSKAKKLKTNNCEICNSTSARPIQKIDEFTIVKCNGCSLVYYIPVLSKSELSAYYDSSYYSREKQFYRLP